MLIFKPLERRKAVIDLQDLVKIDEPSKKEKILKASLAIFSKKGFPEATMREIAQKAGVSLGLIYFYFKNKDDILKEIFIRINSSFPKEVFEETSEADPKEILGNLCLSHMKFLARNFKQFMMFLNESMNNNKLGEFLYTNGMEEGFRDIGEIFSRLQNKSKFRKFDTENATSILLNSLFMFVLFKEGPFKKQLKDKSYEEYGATLTDIFINGMLLK